jgi:hypothetical protein
VAEAKALYREVVAGFTAHYGGQHVQTLTSKMNLAGLLLVNEGTPLAMEEAEKLYREVLLGHVAFYGKDHVTTLESHMNLAECLEAQGGAANVKVAGTMYREGFIGLCAHKARSEVLQELNENWPRAFAFVNAEELHQRPPSHEPTAEEGVPPAQAGGS